MGQWRLREKEERELVARELYQVDRTVREMPAVVAFYCHLGLAIPVRSEEQTFVDNNMEGMRLFLDATAPAAGRASMCTLLSPHTTVCHHTSSALMRSLGTAYPKEDNRDLAALYRRGHPRRH